MESLKWNGKLDKTLGMRAMYIYLYTGIMYIYLYTGIMYIYLYTGIMYIYLYTSIMHFTLSRSQALRVCRLQYEILHKFGTASNERPKPGNKAIYERYQ